MLPVSASITILAFSSLVLLDLPEGVKVPVVRVVDGEGREFFSVSAPMIDLLQIPEEKQMNMKMMEAYNGYTAKDIKERKKVVVPKYSDIIVFVKFPKELSDRTKEGKLTPYNYSFIYSQLVNKLRQNPERWTTLI